MSKLLVKLKRFYEITGDGGTLRWSCPRCGGAQLPVTVRTKRRAPACGNDRAFGCPGCETRRRRSEAPGADPVVWYDTLIRDWVVQLPLGERDAGAILPLEIGWYDAPRPAVYRAACDLAHGGDLLESDQLG